MRRLFQWNFPTPGLARFARTNWAEMCRKHFVFSEIVFAITLRNWCFVSSLDKMQLQSMATADALRRNAEMTVTSIAAVSAVANQSAESHPRDKGTKHILRR